MKKLLFFVLITFVSAQSNEKILTLNEPLEGITSMKVNVDFGFSFTWVAAVLRRGA